MPDPNGAINLITFTEIHEINVFRFFRSVRIHPHRRIQRGKPRPISRLPYGVFRHALCPVLSWRVCRDGLGLGRDGDRVSGGMEPAFAVVQRATDAGGGFWRGPAGWLAGQAMPWWFGFLSVGVFLAKILFFIALFIVIRWTLPRFKYDQLMSLGWKVFIPLAFLNIFVVAALVLLRGNS